VTALGSFIDVDDVIKDKAIKAADKVRNKYKGDITIKFINQALKGVIQPVERKWFEEALSFVDIIGGLPKKDEGHEDEHLDILFSSAKKLNKLVHVHVDQLNTEAEKETEQIVRKTEEHGLQGRVVAIHGISLSAHTKKYRDMMYQKMHKSGVMLITCPTAWIDSRRSEVLSVTHNSIAPVEELVAHDIVVGLGTDNIADVYKPFTDGDMWTELRFLLESCHYYDTKQLVNIATVNGRKILGI
jgi:cytosine/adenosine deaminase-related metal-dependent hydrolase